MASPHEVLVTEISPVEVNYDLSATPQQFRDQFAEGTVAVQALETLGCSVKANDTDVYVILPDDAEATCTLVSRPTLEHDSLTNDVDYLVLGGIHRFTESGRPSDLSTRVVEGVVSLLRSDVTVRRHATYRSISVV